MEMRNGNGFGGIIFTLFSFLWVFNAVELYLAASGMIMSHGIKIALEITLLLILVPLTFGFGYFSKLMFWFLVDIDLLFLCKILAVVFHTKIFTYPIAVFTILLGLIAIWIALATVINPLAGRQVFRVAGPLFFAAKERFDFSTRQRIFEVLYNYWRENAFVEMSYDDLCSKVEEVLGKREILPDLYYLWEFGYLSISKEGEDLRSCRLTAAGLDLYEQLVLRKYQV